MSLKTRQKKIQQSYFADHESESPMLRYMEGRLALIEALAIKHNLVFVPSYDAGANKDLISKFVVQLAESRNIKPDLSGLDQIASTFTILAGEPAERERVDDLIVALGRQKVLNSKEVAQLTAAHVAEQYG